MTLQWLLQQLVLLERLLRAIVLHLPGTHHLLFIAGRHRSISGIQLTGSGVRHRQLPRWHIMLRNHVAVRPGLVLVLPVQLPAATAWPRRFADLAVFNC